MPNKLKGYRVMAGLTQKDMAEALGISKISYVQKENDKGTFNINEVKKIIEILNSKLDKVVNTEDIFFE